MLLLGALGADASSPLQPRDSDVDSVPRKTRHSASFESRVFVIGPNKAGTTSLDEHFIHRHGMEDVRMRSAVAVTVGNRHSGTAKGGGLQPLG